MTWVDKKEIEPNNNDSQHFPSEGLYIGALSNGASTFPALLFLKEVDGLCMLYNNAEGKNNVNRCLEQLVWRIATVVPSGECELTVYNGGNPGDLFNSVMQIDNFLFGTQSEKIYFVGTKDAFKRRLDELCREILERMSAVSSAGVADAVAYNETVDPESRIKYVFLFVSDFPRALDLDTLQKLDVLIQSGRKAGIYVLMSWDMNAPFENQNGQMAGFDPRKILGTMMLLHPSVGGSGYQFRNSGHDDVFNKFVFGFDNPAMTATDIRIWAESLCQKVAEAKKAMRPKVEKQDFKSLRDGGYEAVISQLCVTVGTGIPDKRPVELKFNAVDFIHAFILGQSGSGKSVLLNNIITSAILKYSPEDLMLYLMDFKGVEFNRYRGVKHAKAILVDNSDPQMTLEVLRELNDENKRRVKLWQREGVNNIGGYNRKYSGNRLPQILFVADECQVMFKASASFGSFSQVQREISEILNTIATQGRSQGIHMLLATQQLDETDISGQVLKNLTECMLLASAAGDSDRLVPDSSDLTGIQPTGRMCYFHKKQFQSQVQTYYATDDELSAAIAAAREKASGCKSNGEYYFCGSSLLNLADDMDKLSANAPERESSVAMVGHRIGLSERCVAMPLENDYSENVLFFGANRQEQAVGGLMNALMSLIYSARQIKKECDFIVIDCLGNSNARYGVLLSELVRRGFCRLVPRLQSGSLLSAMVDAVEQGTARPTVVAIIGNEHFFELKKDSPLTASNRSQEQNNGGFESLGFDMNFGGKTEMTFRKAISFLLDEGPLQGVHFLMQVDKPGNVMFQGDYGDNAMDKFRHKIIYRSENKYLAPLRLSHDIDVETLGDEEERLRAYCCNEGEEPMLFTPYQMPEIETIEILTNKQ